MLVREERRSMAAQEQRSMTGADRARSPETDLLTRDPVLAEIVRRLVEVLQPERIYLFGSRAQGDAGPDSDYDLLVVVPDDAPPERKSSRLAYEALWGVAVPVDMVVMREEFFDKRRVVIASLPGTVEREGQVLYAA